MKLSLLKNYFTKFEIALWVSSVSLIVGSFLLCRSGEYINLISSLVGVSSLMLCAKGNPLGMLMMIIFSILYGIISYSFAYYGEVITYLGMSAPMSVIAYISWIRNSYRGKRSEVAVRKLRKRDILIIALAAVVITVLFYHLLKHFNNANLIPSTFSVTTSFIAACLTFFRSPWFAMAYALNDCVLILLWVMAAFVDISYISVIVCFVVFLVNDTYSFINWRRMEKRQQNQL